MSKRNPLAILSLIFVFVLSTACGGGGGGGGGGNGGGGLPVDVVPPEMAPHANPGVAFGNAEGEIIRAFGVLSPGNDDLEKITSATYFDGKGNGVSIWFAANGMPAQAVTNDLLFRFTNWTETSVDIYVFSKSEDLIGVVPGVVPDAKMLSDFRSVAALGIFANTEDGEVATALGDATISGWLPSLSMILKGASLGLQLTSCAAALAATPLTLGAASIPAAFACGSYFVSVVATISGSETLDGLGYIGDTVGCALLWQIDSCAGMALTAADWLWQDHLETKKTIAGNGPTQSQVSFGLFAKNMPTSPGANQDATIMATVYPRVAGIELDLDLYGTDDYEMHESATTNASGEAFWVVPGGAAGVRDSYTVSGKGLTFTGSSFSYGGGGGSGSALTASPGIGSR